MTLEHTEVLSAYQEYQIKGKRCNKNWGTACISQSAKQRENEGTSIFLPIFSSERYLPTMENT